MMIFPSKKCVAVCVLMHFLCGSKKTLCGATVHCNVANFLCGSHKFSPLATQSRVARGAAGYAALRGAMQRGARGRLLNLQCGRAGKGARGQKAGMKWSKNRECSDRKTGNVVVEKTGNVVVFQRGNIVITGIGQA